jgi:hypothetical protein
VSGGEWLSLLINLAVGAWFVWGYPHSARRRFRGMPPPPLFALLIRLLPPVGLALIVASLLYGALRLAGAI